MNERGMIKEKSEHTNIINGILCALGGAVCTYGSLDVDHDKLLGVSWWISGSKLFFITNMSLVISLVAFVLAGITYKRKNDGFKKACRELMVCMLSAEVLIMLVFWPIFWACPAAVFPRALREGPQRVGMLANICMHGLPAVLLLGTYIMDACLAPPGKLGMGCYVAFVTGLSMSFYKIRGFWRYRILSKFSTYLLVLIPFILFVAGCLIAKALHQLKLKVRRSRAFRKHILRTARI
ncbi:uncharacterized protein NEMAJ01_1471 [Nematocida major]|uniref:uncharacterized protein n=1 Tax=Nematocida major TaxID=1912982 RepID=UPI0020074A45|nr:uncharacterized protein NEMAJ01_1471 [Nematocida major]KAH9386575.1 hypothetical protein NEMAJ01_1471 [Nematocida major]